ncbi:hypothetical protein PALI_a1711 [Pseudoalteromonas aliena SW19]|uniref:Orphan protein n=1 Tax=Pseudoalteromonas aliena SW19 TaxID=1314866 RepID=A0ABR9DXN8_9GAMM|nr:hypothetical protein [Pseudoalteromonas aliena SW19]
MFYNVIKLLLAISFVCFLFSALLIEQIINILAMLILS